MTGRLEGKVALITGGASGIGRAATLRFLDEGARVVIADMNALTAEETLGLASQSGHRGKAVFIRTNVAEEAEIEAAVSLALREFGRLDCVFNNAGVGGAFGPFVDTRVEDWDFTFDVLVRGVFLGCKHGARAMIAQGEGGTLIQTASVAGMGGGAGPTAYSAAKAAVINLTHNLAVELAPHRIRVNSIAPGGIMTPLLHRGAAEDAAKHMTKLQPWPEAGQPDDIANAALFLASDESRFVTGANLAVDGGLTGMGPDMIRRSGGGPLDKVGSTMSGRDNGSTGEPPILHGKKG
jgi:NAD(P)-dependent dehydrogenase (short-subunit alcohol dehydrogenase family)